MSGGLVQMRLVGEEGVLTQMVVTLPEPGTTDIHQMRAVLRSGVTLILHTEIQASARNSLPVPAVDGYLLNEYEITLIRNLRQGTDRQADYE